MKNKDYLAVVVVVVALFLANLLNITQLGIKTIALPINPKNGYTWHCNSYDFQIVTVDDGYILEEENNDENVEVSAASEIAKTNENVRDIQYLKLVKGKNIGITTIECKLNKTGERQVGGNTYIVFAITNELVFFTNVNVLVVICVSLLIYALIVVLLTKREKKKFKKKLNEIKKKPEKNEKNEKKGKFIE